MQQHMQYTVYKCVYFLYSALLNHKRQEQQQQQQQSAATMPSKPAVTGKCQCFKNPTPLMSAAVKCVCSRVYAALCLRVGGGGLREHTASSYYAHPRCNNGKQEGTHVHAVALTSQPTFWCHFVRPRPPQQQLIVQLLLPVD